MYTVLLYFLLVWHYKNSFELFWIHVIYLPIPIKVVGPLALGQSYDCPGAREIILKEIDKIDEELTTQHNKERYIAQQSTKHTTKHETKHNKALTMFIF